MLSFKAEMTHVQLGDIVLPPTYIWYSRRDFGCEWLLWPEPTEEENITLSQLNTWDKPNEGRVMWEKDDLIYTPSDMIAALTLPVELRHMILCVKEGGTKLDVTKLIDQHLFSGAAILTILGMMPLGARIWDIPYPNAPYPEKLLKWKKRAKSYS